VLLAWPTEVAQLKLLSMQFTKIQFDLFPTSEGGFMNIKNKVVPDPYHRKHV